MKTVLAEIKSFLPAKYAEAEVRIQTVVKNNDQKLDGLSIVLPGVNIAPTIYLNSFWKEYEAGKNMEDILEQIAEIRVEHEVTNDFDINEISNFERVKERITCRLVNAEQNAADTGAAKSDAAALGTAAAAAAVAAMGASEAEQQSLF